MTTRAKYQAHAYHGGPYDRGGADSYYRRPRDPHKYPAGSFNGERVTLTDPDEIAAYHAGYDHNQASGNHKDWG